MKVNSTLKPKATELVAAIHIVRKKIYIFKRGEQGMALLSFRLCIIITCICEGIQIY